MGRGMLLLAAGVMLALSSHYIFKRKVKGLQGFMGAEWEVPLASGVCLHKAMAWLKGTEPGVALAQLPTAAPQPTKPRADPAEAPDSEKVT